jgi:hypothetical protein
MTGQREKKNKSFSRVPNAKSLLFIKKKESIGP